MTTFNLNLKQWWRRLVAFADYDWEKREPTPVRDWRQLLIAGAVGLLLIVFGHYLVYLTIVVSPPASPAAAGGAPTVYNPALVGRVTDTITRRAAEFSQTLATPPDITDPAKAL